MIYTRRLALLGLLIAVGGCAPQPVTPVVAQKDAPAPAKSQPVAKTDAPAPAKVQAEVEVFEAEVAEAKPETKRPEAKAPQKAADEPFRFAETESGRLLASLLTPEKQPLPPLAIPNSPKPGRRMLLESLGLETYRTPLEVSSAPKGLVAQPAPRAISTPGELPPLATTGLPTLPAPITMPTAPRLYAPSPTATLPGTTAGAAAGIDPVADAARGALLREPVAGRATPAAPLPLDVANPFQASRDAALRRPPEELPAAAGEGTRPRVNLPVPPKP